jgi:hypothetical protein
MRRPECPYCKHVFTDDEIWSNDQMFPTGYLEDNDFNCPGCKKMLHVSYDPIPDWVFYNDEGEELTR